MEAYIPSLLIALVVVSYIWAVVIARSDGGPVARSYHLFSGVVVGWLLLELLLNFSVLSQLEWVLARLFAPFWISLGFVFLNFAQAVAGLRRGFLWWVVLTGTLIAVAVTVSTDLVILGFDRLSWGVFTRTDPVMHVLVTVPGMVGGAAGLIAIFVYVRRATGELERRAATSLLIGGVPTLSALLFFNIVLPDLVNGRAFPTIGSPALMLFVLLVYRAVSRFRFMEMSIEQIVGDLFRGTSDGVLLVGEDGLIRRANEAAAGMLPGVRPLEGRSVDEVLPGAWEPDFKGSREVSFELDGERRTSSVSVSSSRLSGMVEISALIVKDVTAIVGAQDFLRESRNRLEREVRARTQEFRRAQKMEAMGILGTGIAHDFNNLLAAVMGFASAARDDLPDTHPIREDLEEVLQATKRGRDIVRQMLSFSQADRERTRVNLARMARETLKLMEPSRPGGVMVEIFSGEKDLDVEVDATGLHQVMVNLIKNAYQAMTDAGGVLRISTFPERLEETPADGHGRISPGQYVAFRISDEGPGIDGKVLARIFDPFFTTKSEGEGTGLGLSMVEGIVGRFGGTITARSEPGRGSEFTVYLPRSRDAVAGEEEREESALGGAERILLVDDKDQVLRVGKRMLEQLGYRVATVADPREVQRILSDPAGDFDLVITDLSMPGMSGIEVGRMVGRLDTPVPVILLSGNLTRRDREEAERAGIRHTLFKPLTKGKLAQVVREVLDAEGGEA